MFTVHLPPRHFGLMFVFALAITCGASAQAEEKLGLLLIGHGSRQVAWNQSFLEFGKRVGELAEKEGQFTAVRTVFMEFASPAISDGIRELEQKGCTAIVAVPAFVMVGHHTLFDIPAALGIFYSKHAVAHLAEHGGSFGVPRVPILYTAALDEGDLLEQYALWELQQISQDAENEAIVFLVHGDAEQKPLVERRLRALMNWCCAKSGITFADYATIGVGQGFEHHGLPVLLHAAERKRRVLVIGLYVALSAERIFQRASSSSPRVAQELKDRDIVFSKGSLIDFPGTAHSLLETAHTAAKLRSN